MRPQTLIMTSAKSGHPPICKNGTLNVFFISYVTIFVLISSFWLGVFLGGCKSHGGRWSVRVLWQRNSVNKDSKGVEKISADGLSQNVYVNLHRDDVTALGVKRPKLMAFVGIMTAYASSGRRQSMRKTWMPSNPQSLQRTEEATGLAFRFVIGRTNNKTRGQEFQKELVKHDDFMVLDFEEEQTKPSYKIYSFFTAAYALFDCEYYVKVEDDIYLRPDRLSLLLAKDRPHPQTYLGCMSEASSSELKWLEKQLLGAQHVVHAQKSIYALSADIVANMVALGRSSLRMFHSEDASVGVWMLAMNVSYEDNKYLCQSKCSTHSIAVSDFPNCTGLCDPEERLLELHGQAMCSTSPTTNPQNQVLKFLEWGNLLRTQGKKGQGHSRIRHLQRSLSAGQ